MNKIRNFSCALLLGGILLSGCVANNKVAFRKKELSNEVDQVIAIDAKQRAILTTQGEKKTTIIRSEAADGTVRQEELTSEFRRFCAEPSPDVFSVLAQSFSASGSFGQEASDPKAVQAAMQAAATSNETGSSIPRTQTMNMLRELMYRTCERYLNDGIGATELSVQAIRDQRLMVSILAIEQLTGAVTPSPVVLKTGGSASGGLGGDAIAVFDRLAKAKEEAEEAEEKAKSAYDEKFGEGKSCTAIAEATEAGTDLTDEQKEEAPKCDELKSAKSKASKDAEAARSNFETVKKAIDTGGVSVSTVADAIAQGGLNRASPGSVGDVSTVVKDIVAMNFDDNSETLLFCLSVLRDPPPRLSSGQSSPLIEQCISYLQADVDAATQKLLLNAEKYSAARSEVTAVREASFEQLWNKVKNGPGESDLAADKLKKLADAAFPPPANRNARQKAAYDALIKAKTKTELAAAFRQATPDVRIRLSE
ncbi:hypothetical protein [Altererythrobacter fulvus]|uniref:hypothetical protein n=1 Tax=Caenibius fulvus TaxID=2126012 RepID=UPI00301604D1